jgi:hypothetical protein
MSTSTTRFPWLLATLALGALAAAMACLLLFMFMNKAREPIILPAEDEVEFMTAYVEDLEKEMAIPPVPEFRVPPQYVPVLLNGLKPARRFGGEWSSGDVKIGGLVIHTKAGSAIHVEIYDIGKTVAGFSVDGVPCVRAGEHKPVFVCDEYQSYHDDSVLLTHIIREIHKELESGRSDRLKGYIEDLERSKGERPPATR